MKFLNRIFNWLFSQSQHQEKGLLDPQTQKEDGK